MTKNNGETAMEKIYKSGKTGFCNKRREQRGKEMRKPAFLLILPVFILLALSFASAAYKPPYYIANPETKECQYYFAGEQDCFDACMQDCQGAGLNYTNCMEPCANKYCHYNLKPEGFTVDIGKTADFASINESCKVWNACLGKQGIWNSTTIKCEMKPAEKESGNAGISGLNLAAMIASIIILAAAVLLYIQTRKTQRKILAGNKEHNSEHKREHEK